MSPREVTCARSYRKLVSMLREGKRREKREDAEPQAQNESPGDMRLVSCGNWSMESWLQRGNGTFPGWSELPRVWQFCPEYSVNREQRQTEMYPEEGDNSFRTHNLRRTMKKIRRFSLETRGCAMEGWEKVSSNNWKAVFKRAQTDFVWPRRAVPNWYKSKGDRV